MLKNRSEAVLFIAEKAAFNTRTEFINYDKEGDCYPTLTCGCTNPCNL